jgi:hypothetical protein
VIFRQLFDSTSGTYTYLIASRHGGEALIIDPVLDKWGDVRINQPEADCCHYRP